MIWEYLMRIGPCVLLLFSGVLIAGDRTAKRRIVSMLATFGMANDDTNESIEASATAMVKVLYVAAFLFFLWFAFFFYQQHRRLTVRPKDDSARPYKEQAAPATPQTPSTGTAQPSGATSGTVPGTTPQQPSTTVPGGAPQQPTGASPAPGATPTQPTVPLRKSAKPYSFRLPPISACYRLAASPHADAGEFPSSA
ncbi:MAG: hypothetical protein HY318_20615 [Armatimonadetes bacterium]|nr:hypothetical protein [Armatimonadota bacterium]